MTDFSLNCLFIEMLNKLTVTLGNAAGFQKLTTYQHKEKGTESKIIWIMAWPSYIA